MTNKNTQGSLYGAYAPEPRVYELGYHLMPSLSEGDLSTERDALVALITRLKGIVISEGQPVLIDLAYTMSKIIKNKKHDYDQANFGWIKFDISPDVMEEFALEVEKTDALIRYIVAKTVRENTLTSDQPFKTARLQESAPEVEEVAAPVADIEVSSEEATEAPAEEASTEAEANPTDAQEDLTKIEGIGPKIAEVFAANGIATFEALSGSKVGDLRTILADNDLAQHDPSTWKKQATLAKNGKWDDLKTLQDELDGGKE